jgi:predicted PurR-regulated permease PerM
MAAGLLYPAYLRLVRRLGGRRRLAASVVCLLLVTAVLLPVVLTAQAVSTEALAFYDMTTSQIADRSLLEVLEQRQDVLDRVNRLLRPLGETVTAREIYDETMTIGVRLGGFFYRQGVSLAKHLLRFLLGFTFWVIIVFYLLVDGDHAVAWFRDTLPLPGQEQELLAHRFMDMSSSIVVGNGLAGVIQGVAGGILFAILGLPGPALWGVVMFLLAFIPVVGISFVYIPATVILLLVGDTGRAMLLFVPLAVLATVVEYFLKPMLVGRGARLHTLLVFLSLIGGLQAFGAVGLLLGPLAMTAFLTLASLYREHYNPYAEEPCPGDEDGESGAEGTAAAVPPGG